MIEPTSHSDWQIRGAYSHWFKETGQPNVAVTATLSQSISFDAPNGKGWVRADPIAFDTEYQNFIRALSKAVISKSIYRRTKKRLPNCASVEGDGVLVPYHLHMALQMPSWMAFGDFEAAIKAAWFHSPWAKPDIKIEEIEGDWVGYCFKKGPETLLFA
jgi:hypothetical protein